MNNQYPNANVGNLVNTPYGVCRYMGQNTNSGKRTSGGFRVQDSDGESHVLPSECINAPGHQIG